MSGGPRSGTVLAALALLGSLALGARAGEEPVPEPTARARTAPPAAAPDTSAIEEKAAAIEHPGSWDLSDGSRVLSTGRSTHPELPYDPTARSGRSERPSPPVAVFPYVLAPRPPVPHGR